MAQEPAWKAELRGWIEGAVGGSERTQEDALRSLLPYVKAAEQRGFSAGASKAGTRLKAENERLRRRAKELDR